MSELKFRRQSVKYKLKFLEDELKDHSQETLHVFKGYLRNVAFETGLKIVLALFFRRRKRKRKKPENERLSS